MIDQRDESVPPYRPFDVPEMPSVQVMEELEAEPVWTPRADRRGSREKFAAGLRGLKYAIRGDSSFFAHGYRGVLIAMTAALLRVDPLGWCFLVIAGCFVLLAEITHSAVDTLARVGDPEDLPIRVARDIAAAGVLVAAFTSGGLTVTVLAVKFGELLNWWGR